MFNLEQNIEIQLSFHYKTKDKNLQFFCFKKMYNYSNSHTGLMINT